MDDKRQHNMPLKSKPSNETYGISLYGTQGHMESRLSSSFTESDLLLFVYKKAEKHAAVSYMLTNFLSDNEPLKWKLRGNSISFLSLINNLRSTNNNGAQRLLGVVSKIDELQSLYQIMRLGGHVSEMNLNLVNKELSTLKNLLEDKITQKSPIQEITIEQTIFNDRLPEKATKTSSASVNIKDNNIYKEQKISQRTKTDEGKKYTPRPVARKFVSQPKVESIEKTKPQKTHKEARRESIKTILHERGELTIKDIAVAISGCSEKTVQRELNALIKDNIVKREGERRWSKYSLV